MYIMTSCVLWTIVLFLLLFCIPLLVLILILIQLHLLVLFSSTSNQTIFNPSHLIIIFSFWHKGYSGGRGVSDVWNGRIYVYGDEIGWVCCDWGLNVVYMFVCREWEHSYPLYIQHLMFMFIYNINSPSPAKIQLLCWYSLRDTYYALILHAIYPCQCDCLMPAQRSHKEDAV